MLGTTLKEAIRNSGVAQEEVAASAEMSLNNLYKIFRKDSMESRYLVRICRKLQIPYSALLGPEDWLDQDAPTAAGHVQTANQVKKNQQNISVGTYFSETEKELRHQLQLCIVERESLATQLQMQKEINELLRGK